MTLTFRLDGLGGFNFGGVKQANVTRLPWGGSGSELVAFVRGPFLLVNRIYNEERLIHFQQRVLTPTLLQIVATMIDAERAHLKTCSDLAADEKQTADARNACLHACKPGLARCRRCRRNRRKPSGQVTTPCTSTTSAVFLMQRRSSRCALCGASKIKNARAFSMDSGIIGVHARVQGAEPTMKRLINKVHKPRS